MKNIFTNVVSFAFGTVIGTAIGFTIKQAADLMMPEMRQISEEMSKYFDQI